jgi:FMNH2-dependent dimethyl sulfone monooxygenase
VALGSTHPVAELNLNDIKGMEAPSLDAWSTAAALAAVTKTLELMVAVRPTMHHPSLLAKQAANIDHISGGRVSLNVVSSWWRDEAPGRYPVRHPRRPIRGQRSGSPSWTDCGKSRGSLFWTAYQTNAFSPADTQTKADHLRRGESEAAKNLIPRCGCYVMHGDPPEGRRRSLI